MVQVEQQEQAITKEILMGLWETKDIRVASKKHIRLHLTNTEGLWLVMEWRVTDVRESGSIIGVASTVQELCKMFKVPTFEDRRDTKLAN